MGILKTALAGVPCSGLGSLVATPLTMWSYSHGIMAAKSDREGMP